MLIMRSFKSPPYSPITPKFSSKLRIPPRQRRAILDHIIGCPQNTVLIHLARGFIVQLENIKIALRQRGSHVEECDPGSDQIKVPSQPPRKCLHIPRVPENPANPS